MGHHHVLMKINPQTQPWDVMGNLHLRIMAGQGRPSEKLDINNCVLFRPHRTFLGRKECLSHLGCPKPDK